MHTSTHAYPHLPFQLLDFRFSDSMLDLELQTEGGTQLLGPATHLPSPTTPGDLLPTSLNLCTSFSGSISTGDSASSFSASSNTSMAISPPGNVGLSSSSSSVAYSPVCGGTQAMWVHLLHFPQQSRCQAGDQQQYAHVGPGTNQGVSMARH